MTYQELLEQFCNRKAAILADPVATAKIRAEVDMLEWAVQSILENLKEKEINQGEKTTT